MCLSNRFVRLIIYTPQQLYSRRTLESATYKSLTRIFLFADFQVPINVAQAAVEE